MQRRNAGRGVVWLVCLLAGLLAGAVVPNAQAQDVPFKAVINEDTDVLAGGASKYYAVGHLTKGTLVNVNEIIEGYYAITPPPNVFSFISKGFVDAKGDGKHGEISSDGAKFKAASVQGEASSYKPQGSFNKGEKVEIVGEDGSFYKIVTPANKGISVYLRPGVVTRVQLNGAPKPAGTGSETTPPAHPTATPPSSSSHNTPPTSPLATATTAPSTPHAASSVPVPGAGPATTRPATTHPAKPKPPTTHPKPKPVTPSHPPVTVTPVPSAPAPAGNQPSGPSFTAAKAMTPAVQGLEARLVAAQALPLEKQPLSELLEGYNTAAMDPNLPLEDRRIVMTRVAQIKHSQEIADALKSLDDATTKAGGSAPMAVPTVVADAPASGATVHFDMVGQLLASGVYDGDAGPRLFRLVEPASSRTIAYVQPGKFNTKNALGRIVGINGQTKYDPALKISVVEVTKLEVLQPSAAPGSGPGSGPGNSTPGPGAAAPGASAPKAAAPAPATPASPATTEPDEEPMK